MKISRMRHVIITSIIFLIIIAIIISVYNSKLKSIASNTEELKYRVIAKTDILPNELITKENVEIVQIQDVIKVDNLVYRMNKNDTNRESVLTTQEYETQLKNGNISPSYPNDNRWAIGKVATTKIHKGEILVETDIKLPEEIVSPDQRIYSIPFDSLGTGGYNVGVGDFVDICVLYNENSKNIQTYQNLPTNKTIDIVLAKKEIADIRDESGNSKINNSAVVPGYMCFNLTYEEINKIELAKRQGKVFAGISEDYMGEARTETFMSGIVLPSF